MCEVGINKSGICLNGCCFCVTNFFKEAESQVVTLKWVSRWRRPWLVIYPDAGFGKLQRAVPEGKRSTEFKRIQSFSREMCEKFKTDLFSLCKEYANLGSQVFSKSDLILIPQFKKLAIGHESCWETETRISNCWIRNSPQDCSKLAEEYFLRFHDWISGNLSCPAHQRGGEGGFEKGIQKNWLHSNNGTSVMKKENR